MKRALVAALLGTSMLVAPAVVLAKQASEPAQATRKQSKDDYNKMMKLSDDGFSTVRDVRAARIAIFDASPDTATKKVDQALEDIGKAQKDAMSYVGRTGASKGADEWIPVDALIDVADNYTLSDQKKQHVAQANAHLKAGEGQKAVEQLKLAEIDVNFTRLMLPLKATTDHLKVAKSLLGERKYYEANSALKAAEDGLVMDSVALIDVPTTGQAAKKSAGNASSSTQAGAPVASQHANNSKGTESKPLVSK